MINFLHKTDTEINFKQLHMESFLKWAGGKRWLIGKLDGLLPDMSKTKRYFEPFLGGGSMFFHLEPNAAVLSDTNEDLINTYSVIRDDWFNLFETLKIYQAEHSHKFYYDIRASKPESKIDKAVRFIYLNRTCWNGLYRVNLKGEFNVPIGTKTSVIFETDNFEKISNQLKCTNLISCDFEQTINTAQVDDFVFVDPPYTVKHNMNGFVKYNETIFSWQDQVRLRDAVVRAVSRGVKVLMTNAHHKSIEELYDGYGNIHFLNRSSVIAGKPEARGKYTELILTSY